ncbi:anti-sigma factor RsbA family regulatory protein [Herbidospora cretacea]|uniref:anti-sigma factor RsbA family regulatory protein n=1 Tax=Herbidospora cretacea TaxID=28444 RepID=UPI000AD7FACD|nr:anti-sigma factor RsbA family regulatory protein [Herbidospora cretacea]
MNSPQQMPPTQPLAGEIHQTGDEERFWHPALFYRGESEYLAGTVPFVADGIRAGQPVAVSVPGPRLRLLRGALAEELGEQAGQVVLLDMTQEGRNPGRIIPGVLRAFADRHPQGRVRIIGEPIWADRDATEYPACAQHEALINLAFAGREVSILCPYDVEGLQARVLEDALRTHPVVLDADGERHSDSYAPQSVVADYNLPLPDPQQPAAVLEFDAATLGRARPLAAQQAILAGLDEERALDLELAVAEITANSIVHGGGTGRLRMWHEDAHVVFDVSDNGHITDPLVGRQPVAPHVPGGRGMLLLNQLADLVRVHTGPSGTTVRAYFAR